MCLRRLTSFLLSHDNESLLMSLSCSFIFSRNNEALLMSLSCSFIFSRIDLPVSPIYTLLYSHGFF